MGQKNKRGNYTFESEISGQSNQDPNFDLDEYIRQKSRQNSEEGFQAVAAKAKKEDSAFKNAILIFLVFTAAFLWVNDWSVSQAWSNIFGSEDPVAEIATNAPSVNLPDVPLPPEVAETSSSFVDYLRTANETGLDEYFSNTALQSMYQANVTISYLQDIVEQGYQDFSFPAIIGFYSGDVSMEYLNELRATGLLEEFSFPAIVAYSNSNVSMEYLGNLQQAEILESFSYPAIISFYNSDVSVDYLNELNNNGYLTEFSYPAIVAFYNSGVTLDFLNQLAENNLLDGMSYPDIVSAYNADN